MFHEVCGVWTLVRLIWWVNVLLCAGQDRCLDSVTVSHATWKISQGFLLLLADGEMHTIPAHTGTELCFYKLKLRINREQPGDCLQSHSEYIPRNPSRSQRLAAQFGTGKLAWSVFHLFSLQDLLDVLGWVKQASLNHTHWSVCVTSPSFPEAGALEWMLQTWKALFSLVTHTEALLLGCAPWVTGLH